jgi:hypothetical protein
MPFSLMMLPQRADSAATNALKAGGVSPPGSAPSVAICSFTSGWLRTLASSAPSRATISDGVPLATKMPFHPTIS